MFVRFDTFLQNILFWKSIEPLNLYPCNLRNCVWSWLVPVNSKVKLGILFPSNPSTSKRPSPILILLALIVLCPMMDRLCIGHLLHILYRVNQKTTGILEKLEHTRTYTKFTKFTICTF